MKLTVREKKIYSVFLSLLIMIVIYILAVLFMPNMSLWARIDTVSESNSFIPVKVGYAYTRQFEMHFSKICSIEIPMENGEADHIISIDGTIELIDNEGMVVAEKRITSVYDNVYKFKYKNVNRGEIYTLRFTVNSLGNSDTANELPLIGVSEKGDVAFTVRGIVGNSDDQAVFAIAYFIVACLIILFVLYIDHGSIGDCELVDGLFIGLLMIIAILCVSQFNDLLDISRTALRMLDSFKEGNFFGYIDYAYYRSLENQTASQFLACDYNFIPIFICSIFLIPVYCVYGSDINVNYGGYAAVLSLSFVMAVTLLLSLFLLKRVVKECNMGDRYLANVRLIFISSSMLLYMTIAFGQIDALYLAVIILSLPFYYRKKYFKFSFIMSVAIAMKPLAFMVFMPLLLLANKRVRDILLNFMIAMIFPVSTKVMFEGKIGHHIVEALNDATYGFVGRISFNQIGYQISLFILSFLLICIAAYMDKTDTDNKKELLYKSMVTIFATYACFAAFVDWHQHWLVPIVLAFSFILPYHGNCKKIFVLDIFAEIFFILTANSCGTSTHMINYGIIRPLFGQRYDGNSVYYMLYNISSIAIPAVRTIFVGILLFMAVYFIKKGKENLPVHECSRNWVLGRTGILYGFILFYCWCFSYIG